MARLEGKVALISGGAYNQGAAEARLFAEEGRRLSLATLRMRPVERSRPKQRRPEVTRIIGIWM